MCSLYLSDKATVTYSKNVKDLLIYEASINCYPSDPIYEIKNTSFFGSF